MIKNSNLNYQDGSIIWDLVQNSIKFEQSMIDIVDRAIAEGKVELTADIQEYKDTTFSKIKKLKSIISKLSDTVYI